MSDSPQTDRPGWIHSILRGLLSWRTLSVALMSFSSGLPLGLVWIAIPDWMRASGVDLRWVGLTTLAQAPWTFKMLWAPAIDRWSLPGGRRRGWIGATQIALLATILAAAPGGLRGDAPWLLLAAAFAIAIASASHDIVVDAYAVEVLDRDEQAVAVGLRTALYRVAMLASGGLAITLAGRTSWPLTCGLLAVLYVPLFVVTRFAGEPKDPGRLDSIRQAVWRPFVAFLSRRNALTLLAFVVLYKLCDNLSQALLRPFLVDMGYDADARGLGYGIVGLWATMVGTFCGGFATRGLGLARSLWVFGFLQIGSNLGYILLTYTGVNVPLMLGALAFEHLTTGLGMGAFGVLLLRMTQREFSATQYALFSSLFALPRILAGPVTGFLVHALGWRTFFWITIAAGAPGLLALARVMPWGQREPRFELEPPTAGRPLARRTLWGLGLGTAFGGTALALAAVAALRWLSARADPDLNGDYVALLSEVLTGHDLRGALTWLGSVAFGAAIGLLVAAVAAARRGGAGGAPGRSAG